MSQRRELAVPRKWTEVASTECIKAQKWQEQVHQGREMAKTSTPRERNGNTEQVKTAVTE